jgi:hypothetical protein
MKSRRSAASIAVVAYFAASLGSPLGAVNCIVYRSGQNQTYSVFCSNGICEMTRSDGERYRITARQAAAYCND